MSTSIYNPLDRVGDIQVLELQYRRFKKELRVILHHRPLDAPPSFKSLTYAWWRAGKCELLKTPEGVISVTTSLVVTPKRFHYHGDPLMI
jgi:hypothetical protein